jgi:periplasmic protein CpxP/Spy
LATCHRKPVAQPIKEMIMSNDLKTPITASGRFLNGRRVAIAAVVAGLTAISIGAVASQPQWAGGQGGGWGQGGGMPGQGMMMGFGRERMFERALSSVGATSEQKLKIVTIAQDARRELMPLRDRRYAAKLKLAILMKADTVDRAAIEKLRAEEFAAYEAGSKRAAQAMADAAEVLTPAQRKQLVDRWENRWNFTR